MKLENPFEMIARGAVAALVASAFLFIVAPAGADPGDPKVLARAAILGCQQHWDRFEILTMSYEQYGCDQSLKPPQTLEEAVGLKWKKMDKFMKCQFALDGTRWVMRVDYDDPPFNAQSLVKDKANPGLAWGRTPITQRYLGNGSENLYYTPIRKFAALFEDGTGDRLGGSTPRSSPLHILGFRNLERNLKELLYVAERDQKPWSAGPPVVVNGARCVPVAFEIWPRLRAVFYLDPSRGYVPIRIQDFEMRNDQKEVEVVRTEVLELRPCSNDRWFPTKIVTVQLPATAGSFQPAVREVISFDLDRRPTKDELSVEMEAGTRITRQSDSKIKATYGVTLRQGERVSPDDLGRFIEISEKRHREILADTAIHPESHWPLWWYVVAGVSVVLLCAAVWYWRVARQRARAAAGTSPGSSLM